MTSKRPWERKCVSASGKKKKKTLVFQLCMMAFSHSGKHLNKECVFFYIFIDAFNAHLLTGLSDGQRTENVTRFCCI